jgi:hypothetical protein
MFTTKKPVFIVYAQLLKRKSLIEKEINSINSLNFLSRTLNSLSGKPFWISSDEWSKKVGSANLSVKNRIDILNIELNEIQSQINLFETRFTRENLVREIMDFSKKSESECLDINLCRELLPSLNAKYEPAVKKLFR